LTLDTPFAYTQRADSEVDTVVHFYFTGVTTFLENSVNLKSQGIEEGSEKYC